MSKKTKNRKIDVTWNQLNKKHNILDTIKEKGYFIAYKSGEIEEELQGSRRAIKVLKGELSHIKTFEIAENSRTIIVIEKVASTPKIYPRQAGKPGRLPIKK